MRPGDLKSLGQYFAESMRPFMSELVAVIRASDPWLDTEQAADYVGAKPRSLRDLARSGQLPHGRYGNGERAEYRFKRSALDEYLSSNGRRTDE